MIPTMPAIKTVMDIPEMPVKGTFLLKVFSKNRKHTIISKLIILPFEVIFINMKDDKHIKI